MSCSYPGCISRHGGPDRPLGGRRQRRRRARPARGWPASLDLALEHKLSVLGMAELSDNTVLWERKIDKFKDDKPCTLTGT